MYYEPDTVWGRTVDGDREIDWPTSDLSLVQRQMLADLGEPRTFAQLATQYRIDAPRLERELSGLADARLVTFQAPDADIPVASASVRTAQEVPAPAGAKPWKPGPAAYAIAIGLGFMAVIVVLV